MKQFYLSIFLFLSSYLVQAQSMYFPPLTGSQWDTLSPTSLGWCSNYLDSLDQLLVATNSKAFILLKDGKIVHEKYIGTFTQDSLWYWASAGKSLTSMLVGIAQQEAYLSLSDLSSTYLGQGWTSAPLAKENLITVKNQLSMTSGLDDGVDNPDCTTDTCLVYLADAGTRWAYHNAPYTLLDGVIQGATGLSLNSFLQSRVKVKTGMTGLYVQTGDNNVYFSTARSMARYGLLALNKGVWNGDSVLKDQVYYNQMINTSQNLNESYGYLWWLNGKPSYRLPQSQFQFTGSIIPNGPADLFCALGKNDQKIHVVPSQGLVWVRMGNAATPNQLVPLTLDNEVWAYLNGLMCSTTVAMDHADTHVSPGFRLEENKLIIDNPLQERWTVEVVDAFGRSVLELPLERSTSFSLNELAEGLYVISLQGSNRQQVLRWVKF
jgi:CubicO group peptidase (beta-lactamase class C family)